MVYGNIIVYIYVTWASRANMAIYDACQGKCCITRVNEHQMA